MTNRWVVDASVVAKFYLRDEDHAEIARDLLNDFAAGSVDLIAPQLLLYEVSSAILRAVRRRRLSAIAAADALAEFHALGVQLIGDSRTLPSMIRDAYHLAAEVNCALYDAVYLVLANQLGLSLITADARVFRSLSSGRGLVWIGDYQPDNAS